MNAAGRREIERQLEAWGAWMIMYHSVLAGVPSSAGLWFEAGGGTPGSRELGGSAPVRVQVTHELVIGLPDKEKEAVFVYYALPASLDEVKYPPERRCFECGLDEWEVRYYLGCARERLFARVISEFLQDRAV